jgi:hypothetical protein
MSGDDSPDSRDGLSPALREKAEFIRDYLITEVGFRPGRADEVVREMLADASYRAELEGLDRSKLEPFLDLWTKEAIARLRIN